MGLLEVPIPNFLGGVSQQPAALRQPGQLEDCINALLHPVNGASKRRGTRHIAKLFDGSDTVLNIHLSDRSEAERYFILFGHKQVRVFHADTGREHLVAMPLSDDGYLDSRIPPNYLPDLNTSSSAFSNFAEDFGGGRWTGTDWERNAVAGEGPFFFGAGDGPNIFRCGSDGASAATVTAVADQNATFAEVFVPKQVFSIYFKEAPGFVINDVVLSIRDTTAVVNHTARFDFDVDGVPTLGPVSTGVVAGVEAPINGWYRCWVMAEVGVVPTTVVGSTRLVGITYDSTVPGTPSNKQLFHFGARIDEGVDEPQPYTQTAPDWLKAITISDTTLVLNTAKEVALTTGAASYSNRRGYFWVRQGGINDVQYKVTVGYVTATVPGSATFSHTTPATLTVDLQTDDDIAEGLRALIDANANLVAVRTGSVVQVRHTSEDADNYITSIEVSDSRGDATMVAVTLNADGISLIEQFTNLPLIFDSDQRVLVTGNPERGADDYYVRFVADTATSGNLGRGHWEETLAPFDAGRVAILPRLDRATMPHKLTRFQDDAVGTLTGIANEIFFQYEDVDWDDMLVGDSVSNPPPHFVTRTIADLFLYRGRLGFLVEDHVALSEAGEVFNFFRSTVLDLVDTDPIDVASGTRDVVTFKNAASTADSLLAFSDRHQFQLLGDPVLTPATAQLSTVRAFRNLTTVRPADSGRGIIFASQAGSFSSLHEATLLTDDVSFRFEELTAQAPRYIVGEAAELAHSSLAGMTVIRATDPTALFIHQSYRDDQENRLQSAIHRWAFDADTAIRGLGFLAAELRLIVERAEGWFLETVATDTETLEGELPVIHLDRRVNADQVTRVYSGAQDETEITLPYELSPTATYQVVDGVSGLLTTIIAQTATSVTVAGDMSEGAIFVGEQYDHELVLSEPVIADQSPRGGLIPRMGRPVDVHRLALYVSGTAFLSCEVDRDLRTATTEEFSAAGLGTGLLVMGQLNLYSGDLAFAIIGQSVEVTVTLQNPTPFPSYVQSGRWEVLNRARAGLA